MLELAVHKSVRFLFVSPHYPENLGAACRAMKTMGFLRAGLVRPGRLAVPSHPMARKMAVKSLDVLDATEIYDNLDEAIVGCDVVIGSTARRGVSGVFSPAHLAPRVLDWAARGRQVAFVFGNEKSGLTSEELDRCDTNIRIPMVADQPSLNLAQAVQVVAYQLLSTALEERTRVHEPNRSGASPGAAKP